MKNFLLFILFFLLLLLAGFMLFSDSIISIQWLNWNIEIDAFLLVVVWVMSFLVCATIVSILRTPRKIKTIIQKRKIGKSTSQFNRALLHYLNDDFSTAFDAFSVIKENENYFEAQLMSATSLMRIGELNKTTAIIRKLIRKYPKQGSLLQCLLGKWQLQNQEYHLAYETLANEIKDSSPLPQKWFLFMQATEKTKRLDEWQLLLPAAKKDLSRQDFKNLQTNLHKLQIQHAETANNLKHIWDNINNSERSIPIIAKTYLDRCNQLDLNTDNNYRQITYILKQKWNSEWLWDMVNYQQIKDFHNLLDWCKNTVKQQQHIEDCSYFLSLAVIACRAKLWAISEDFLIQANKSLNKTENDQIIITLIKGWIHSQVEQTPVSSQWTKLMQQYGMNWTVIK